MSEWPPRSKKSSCAPTRPAAEQLGPGLGQRLLDRTAGRDEAGALGEPGAGGVGQGPAVDLAVGRHRHRVQDHERRGDHVLGQPRLEPSPQFDGGGRARHLAPRDEVGGQAHLAGGVGAGRDGRLADGRMRRERRLDLARARRG